MDLSNNDTNFELPQPVGGPSTGTNDTVLADNTSVAPISTDDPGLPQPVSDNSNINPVQNIPPSTLQDQNGSIYNSVSGQSSVPDAAEDADIIEKEWVEKTKAAVANTKDDPFQQNQEIMKIKAEYVKKRYNKDIKPE